MTGLDAARKGAVNGSAGRSLLRSELTTMADIFVESGYATGIFGKWHLGDNYTFRPEDRGFQETVWFPSSSISSIPDFLGNDYFNDTYLRNTRREKFEGYSTDIFFEVAMKFSLKAAKDGKPFFIYISTNTPHAPFIAKDEDIEYMQNIFAVSTLAGSDQSIGGMNLRTGNALPIKYGNVSLNNGDPITIAASNPNATKITMEIEIPAGEHTLQAWFTDEKKRALRGAYFVKVEKL